MEVIDCSAGLDIAHKRISECVNLRVPFRLINVNNRSAAVQTVISVFDDSACKYRIRTAYRALLALILLLLLGPLGLVALVAILAHSLWTNDADYEIIKPILGSSIVVRLVKAIGPIHEELCLPEEGLPEIESSEVFRGDCLDIQNAIIYFAQIRRKYGIEKNVWNPVRENLIRLRHRKSDSTLYVGVVGEASAGKSTFINAMLGFEFLKEDTALGTTAASTILRQGKKLSIKIRYLDGRVEELDAKSLGVGPVRIRKTGWSEKVLAKIHRYTADESIASTIESVEVSLPIENSLLESGVAIVDTPGVNSDNARHNNVTTHAIKDICDIALILVPANVPLSACLSQYIKENLLDVIGRCALVMTQADKLREKERKSNLKYITARLKSATGGSVACSYATSAYYVLNRGDYGRATEEEVIKYRKEFSEVMASLKAIVQKGKSAAILEKMLVFLKTYLVPMLSDLIILKKQEFVSRKENLEKNQLIDIDQFVSEEQRICSGELTKVVVKEEAVIDALIGIQKDFLEQMSNSIFGAEDRDELKRVMEERSIRFKLEKLRNPFADALCELCKPYRDVLAAEMEKFHANFAEAYQRLENISRKESLMSMSNVSNHDLSVSVSVGNFGEAIDSQLGADALKSVGGAGAGAVIGSFICPGLGTIIGGVLGGIFGALFGKSLDTLKQEAYSSICGVADEWFGQMVPQANQYIDNYKKSCEERVKANIASYKDQYGAKIQALIQKERDEQEKLRKLIETAAMDIEFLQSMQPRVAELINSSRIGGTEVVADNDFISETTTKQKGQGTI